MNLSVAGRVFRAAICASPMAFLTPAAAAAAAVAEYVRPAMGTRLGGHWVTHQAIISDATDFLFFGMPEFVPPEIF